MTLVKDCFQTIHELTHSVGCYFFGHRDVKWSQELEDFIYFLCKRMFLENDVKKFFFGDNSDFIKICYKAVTRLQNEFPIIKVITVPVPSMAVLLKDIPENRIFAKREKWMIFDYCVEIPKLEKAGKATYVVRNRYMIDLSEFCIFYYDKNYSPKAFYKNCGLQVQSKSGTKVALDYAIQKKKQIISILDSPEWLKFKN